MAKSKLTTQAIFEAVRKRTMAQPREPQPEPATLPVAVQDAMAEIAKTDDLPTKAELDDIISNLLIENLGKIQELLNSPDAKTRLDAWKALADARKTGKAGGVAVSQKGIVVSWEG
jgi:hypothetical protein